MRIDDFVNLPSSVRNVMYVLGGLSLVGVAGFFDRTLALVVAGGLVAVVLAVLCFFWIRALLRKRRASSLTSELTQHSASAPNGVSDKAGLAKLDDLRRTFAAGVSKFGATDNIYKFPWYLIVGEPGSGKTEAIRNCGVGFPSGMHDKGTEQMGVGGTINMNWWFTNNAVFLDTAGKLMFQDVAPGQNSEWKEFLQLLVRNRRNCPINGLMLIIPADALINDADTGMDAKASKIAAQFEVIQRTLDVRFPVFVIITKCDKLSGFREFFDGFQSADSVTQMLGWSNPDERDVPFAPERVTEHLATVVQRIKRRRLSIMKDPGPQTEARRADEVDALFSLPRSIELIAPRLRQYLEKIFVAGPWSPKPLFLRGIYFTSSMCEGAALDQELALALGGGADGFKDIKVWKRERSYFLKDIFTEKVFREKGLVTRATNTRRMLRTRSLLLWGTATLLSLAFLSVTILGYKKFSESIRNQSAMWVAASKTEKDANGEPDWKNGAWKPILNSDSSGGVAAFARSQESVEVGGKAMELLGYHDALEKATKTEIETGIAFRAGELNEKRLKAQRIVFEGSAVYPIVQAARQRMITENPDSAIDKNAPASERLSREVDALKALLKIEIDKLNGSKATETLADDVFLPLIKYTALQRPNDDSFRSFRETLNATYFKNPDAKWVPVRLSQGYESLAKNVAIDNGLRRLKVLATRSVETQMSSTEDIRSIRDELLKFRSIETQMASFDTTLGEDTAALTALRNLYGKLESEKTSIDTKISDAVAKGVLDRERSSISASYKRVVTESKKASKGDFAVLLDYIKPYAEKPEAGLFRGIAAELQRYSTELDEKVQEDMKKDKPEEMDELDGYLQELPEDGASQRIYVLRFATYRAAIEAAQKTDQIGKLIGTGWRLHADVSAEFRKANEQAKKRGETLQPASMKSVPKLYAPCHIWLEGAEKRRIARIEQAYVEQTRQLFDVNFGPPYVNAGTLYKNKADTLISEWTADQSGGGYSAVTESTKTKLKNFSASFDKMTQAYESKVASDKEQLEYDALHDTWAKKNAKYGYSVSVKNQGIWYTVNDVNIYDKVAFGAYKQVATATGREPVSLRFRTDQDGKVRSGIGVVKPGDITITVDGSEVEVETKPIGEPPGPEPKMPKPNPNRISPPDKQKILDALSGK